VKTLSGVQLGQLFVESYMDNREGLLHHDGQQLILQKNPKLVAKVAMPMMKALVSSEELEALSKETVKNSAMVVGLRNKLTEKMQEYFVQLFEAFGEDKKQMKTYKKHGGGWHRPQLMVNAVGTDHPSALRKLGRALGMEASDVNKLYSPDALTKWREEGFGTVALFGSLKRKRENETSGASGGGGAAAAAPAAAAAAAAAVGASGGVGAAAPPPAPAVAATAPPGGGSIMNYLQPRQ